MQLEESAVTPSQFPTVTVVVTTRNNQQTIRDCVESLLQLDYPKSNLEILVIDASDGDDTARLLEETGIRVIRFQGNAPSAYNFALPEIKGELVGFVDGDAKVHRDWLKQIVKKIDRSNIAGAGGPIETWNRQSIIPRCIGYELEDRYNNPKGLVRMSTTNLVVRKKALVEVKGFDEKLDTGYDADLGFRLRKMGYVVLFAPFASVFHSHRSTFGSYLKQQYVYAKNDIRLYMKDSGLIRQDNVTRPSMLLQPFLFSIFTIVSILNVLGFVGVLGFLSAYNFLLGPTWIVITAPLLLSYVVASTRLAVKARDTSAFPVLIGLLIGRTIAWTLGGIVGIAGSYSTERR